MKIIVDAMGGDKAPDEIVKGALRAADELKLEVVLTGRGEEILRSIERLGMSELPKNISIANAAEVVEMEDDPVNGMRGKKDSSMSVGLKMLHENLGDAFVSAGSTGALLSGATLIVKRIRGIRRAALAPVLPSKSGGFILIDCGANVECTPEYLLQFAYMGSYYSEGVLGVSNPRVGLLNNGAEKTKGTRLQTETYALLEAAAEEGAINFVGNIEGKEAFLGGCDVLVADGFSGNIMLKSVEGASLFLLSEIKSVFTSGLLSKLAALVIKGKFKGLRAKMNPDSVGGTALLGISRPVVKAHGSSGADAIFNAVRQAKNIVESEIVNKLQKNVERMKVGREVKIDM